MGKQMTGSIKAAVAEHDGGKRLNGGRSPARISWVIREETSPADEIL